MRKTSMRGRRLAYRSMLLAAVAAPGAHQALAQTYPTKPVRILTSSAGNSTDYAARTVASELSPVLGQSVIIDNRGSGFQLNVAVATAPPDGYTLLVVGGTLWTGPLFEKAPYDVFRDFAPITTVSRAPNILIVHPSLPVKTVPDLIKLAKAKPGQLNHSSGNTGSSSHMAGELFKSMAGIDIVMIKYKVSQQQMTDLMAGEVQLTFQGGATLAGLAKAGKIKPLASSGAKRSLLYPDLPSVAETLPGFLSESVLGFWAPAKTPDAVVKRLNQEAVRSLEKQQVREHLLKDGQEAAGGSPEQLLAYAKSEVARATKLIQQLGIKPGGS